MKLTSLILTAGLGLTTAIAGPPPSATIFAKNPTVAWNDAHFDLTAGTPFTVGGSPVTITSLGFFDENQDGLSSSHTVALYDPAAALLGSVTVQAGTASVLHDGTRWELLSAPIALSANTTYMLATTFFTTGDQGNSIITAAVTLDPKFTLAGSGFTLAFGQGLNYPATFAQQGGIYIFGGNMEAATVPEPSQWAVMGLTLLGAGAWAARQRPAKANVG